LQEKVKKVEQRADVASRQMVQESYSGVAKEWRDIQDHLTIRCSELNDLVDTWEVRFFVSFYALSDYFKRNNYFSC